MSRPNRNPKPGQPRVTKRKCLLCGNFLLYNQKKYCCATCRARGVANGKREDGTGMGNA